MTERQEQAIAWLAHYLGSPEGYDTAIARELRALFDPIASSGGEQSRVVGDHRSGAIPDDVIGRENYESEPSPDAADLFRRTLDSFEMTCRGSFGSMTTARQRVLDLYAATQAEIAALKEERATIARDCNRIAQLAEGLRAAGGGDE